MSHNIRAMIARRAIWTTWFAVVAACSNSNDNTPPPPAATQVDYTGGSGQSGLLGTLLPQQLSVLVTADGGTPVPNVVVTWSVVEGGGSVSPATSPTNSSGIASAAFTLGPVEGQQRVQAEVSGLAGSPVVFTATATRDPPVATQIAESGGNGQIALAGSLLPEQLSVLVTDDDATPVPDVVVSWSVVDGAGSVSPATSTTNSSGVASAAFTLGPTEGDQRAQAEVSGLAGSPVIFTARATLEPVDAELRVLSGGNNVPNRYTSDLWVHGNHAYTGTWGFHPAEGNVGNVLNVWSLDGTGAPTLANALTIPDIETVSDVEVSSDGQVLMFGAEFGLQAGLHLYSLADPTAPTLLDRAIVGAGYHTATFGEIGGRRYAFAARNPGAGGPALVIYDVTDPANMSVTATVPVPDRYGIHDTFVRDGLAFAFVWDAGVIIFDVGNGIRGGSPSAPVEVSRIATARRGASSPAAHNGWWFHNPVSGERRYLFVGQEGPSITGSSSSGDIHVLDVSDLTQPREVAYFHINGAGTHNFWMDEQKQILYAAYYNGGVVAIDVSGTLSGNLSSRLLSQIKPGGDSDTFTWSVQLANGYLYASDMESGLWQLTTE